MTANPNEVITLIFENHSGIPGATLQSLFQAAGLINSLYTPASATAAWPTLGSMVSSGKRLVVFSDVLNATSAQPWVLGYTDYITENTYENFAPNPTFGCEASRPAGIRRGLTLLNHQLNTLLIPATATSDAAYFPDYTDRAITNSAASIAAHVAKCTAQNIFVNFIEVDFGQTGDVIASVDTINGVSRPKTLAVANGTAPAAASSVPSQTPSTSGTSAGAVMGLAGLLGTAVAARLIVVSLGFL
ncbi:hypothetical protein BDK51DRAFT_34727 [Blyttiomyces helicus]|uniref:PLC-like phosphodiesterase n=1 Tax=Blyttiomyces helicus TaxID=388810 RepID=A0A4P9W8V9_9FUNG|nr:hypothetical protein BDK51DRAFT_34727 [Blyttiomyces helicus]|eukprot:RKO87528.1 hypothetical protein BDK51DRAFT_34727 [Blyttiomyces helicus]